MSSPFTTVRYPDEAWELTPSEKVPKVGDTLRSGVSGHLARALDVGAAVPAHWSEDT